jgi:hypothetical protein
LSLEQNVVPVHTQWRLATDYVIIAIIYRLFEQLAKTSGLSKILMAENANLKGFLPETLAPLVVATQKQ